MASVKPSTGSGQRELQSTPSGRFTATGIPLRLLIARAYGDAGEALQLYRIEGGPSWVSSERFDVVAKAPDGTPEDRLRLMLQTLLADRFKLIAHLETREGDVYGLVRGGRPGPKMKQSSIDCASVRKARAGARSGLQPRDQGAVQQNAEADSAGPPICDTKRTVQLQAAEATVIYTGRGVPLESLVSIVKDHAGRPVIDRTGLAGEFDFDLRVPLDVAGALRRAGVPTLAQALPGAQDGRPAAPEPEGQPPIFRALETQLGLKLVSQRGPVKYLIIDSAERPGPN
ncbi:MAG TPA: TIGR03435 family protein [Gemmatimonadales bacterium]|nr:TIGR03435 family protein [Gemmatimonadales bacterium]